MIEDCCQSLNVKYNNQHCGTFGNTAAFSFFADKAITTAEGGMVVTNNEKIYNKLRYLRNQGRLNRSTFVHPEIGYNFRMTDIQSSIGLVQLQKSDYIFNKRRENYNLYCKLLKNVSEVQILKPTEGTTNFIPFRCVIFVKDDQQDLSDYLKDRGIEARTLFYPLHNQPCFKYFNLDNVNFKNSIYAYNRGMCLPVYPQLTEEQIKYVCDTIKEYYR